MLRPATVRALCFLLLVPLAAGCPSRSSGDGPDMSDDPNRPDPNFPGVPGTITISPNPVEVTVMGTEQTVPLTAESNNYGDVTQKATWTLSDPGLGSVQAGLLTLRGGVGGKAKILATYGVQRGEADLRIKVIAPDVVDPTAPADPRGHFSGPTTGPKSTWVYPLANTMMPRNHPQMDMQFQSVKDAIAYRVRIESPSYVQDVYLGARACLGGIECHFNVPDDLWRAMSRSMAGEQAKLTVSASPGPGLPYGSTDPLPIRFSPEDVRGGLYYWSTTITGLYRVPLGAKKAQVFIKEGNEFGCAGCHTISRDGKKLAMQFGGADTGSGGIVDGADSKKYLLKPPTAGQWTLQTFSPKGDMLLVNWKQQGRVINAETGQKMYDFPERMAQPEWSPDGESIVFVRYPMGGSGDEWQATKAGDIVVMPFNNGKWGTPQVIVASKPGQEYHFYPSWTPDSKWIVFNTGKVPCEGFGGGECNTYDAKNTVLRLVQAKAGATPIDLKNAMHQTGQSTNWPRVAPFIQMGGKLIFFTFSAKFPYGFVKPDPNPQIWMAAIDLEKAASQPDQDPSYAPFWLTFQNPLENNHLGTWTTDLACERDEQCPDDFQCIGMQCVTRTPG